MIPEGKSWGFKTIWICVDGALVFDALLCNLRSSMTNFVPFDQAVQGVYRVKTQLLFTIAGKKNF